MNPSDTTTTNETYVMNYWKRERYFELLFNNDMELNLSSKAHTLELLYDYMMQNKIDINGIVESNTHWEHKKGYWQMKSVTLKFWKEDIITSETESRWNRTHKPEGTEKIIRESLINVIIDYWSDQHKLGNGHIVPFVDNKIPKSLS